MKICRVNAQHIFMVPRAGLEPATLGLEVLCSIQLSYRGIMISIANGANIQTSDIIFLTFSRTTSTKMYLR